MSTRTAELTPKLSLSASITNTLDDGSSTQATITQALNALSVKLKTGVGADQGDRAWLDKRTLASGASEILDLYSFAGLDIGAGAAKDGLGQTLVLEKIVTLCVLVSEDSVGSLEVIPGHLGNAMTWVGSHTVATDGALRAGGILFKHQPDTDGFLGGATLKNLQFNAVGGAVTYSLFLFGRSDHEESSSSSSLSSNSSSFSSTSSLSSTSTLSSNSSSSSSSSSSGTSQSSSSSSGTSQSSASSSSSSQSSLSSQSSASSSSSSSSGTSQSSSSSSSS